VIWKSGQNDAIWKSGDLEKWPMLLIYLCRVRFQS